MTFVSIFAEVMLLTAALPAALALAVGFCRECFARLTGTGRGCPLLVAASICSVPLHGLAQAAACLLFLHRIDGLCLWNGRAPDGEFGYVEHSYRPKNPIAVLGNWMFAIFPAALTLGSAAVAATLCFCTSFAAFCETIGTLSAQGAGIGAYLRAAGGFLAGLFAGTSALPAVAGTLLLAATAFAAALSLRDLAQGLLGLLYFCLPAAAFAGVLCLLDERIRRVLVAGLHARTAAVAALCVLVLAAALAWVAVGALFFLLRAALHLDDIPPASTALAPPDDRP